jgi:acetyl esterase/lipase
MEQQRRQTTTRGRWAAIAVVTGAFLVLGPTTSLAALQMRTTRERVPVGSEEPASPIVTGVSYGPRPEQLLDVYLPSGRTGPFPVIVYAHSGGWIAGSRTNVPEFLVRQVGRAGIAVASIDYRLVTTAPDGSFVNSFPVPDEDVDRAVRFVGHTPPPGTSIPSVSCSPAPPPAATSPHWRPPHRASSSIRRSPPT